MPLGAGPCVDLAVAAGGAQLAEGPGKPLAQLPVLLPLPADLGARGLQPAAQRGLRRPLPDWDRRRSGRPPGEGAEPLDLLAQVPLAVQPGAGDPRRLGDRVEADRSLRRPWRRPTQRTVGPGTAVPSGRRSPRRAGPAHGGRRISGGEEGAGWRSRSQPSHKFSHRHVTAPFVQRLDRNVHSSVEGDLGTLGRSS
jgi:hypothetical protein